MKVLKINGSKRGFSGGIPGTVAELLEQLGIEASTVVAEIDGQIVERGQFSETQLSEGQAIELIRFVPGG